MEPFNIKVGFGDNEVTLTILPTDKGYYKVIYYGAVLGAVRLDSGDCWELVPQDALEAGDLPPYEPDLHGSRLEFVFDEIAAEHIGEEIELLRKEAS